MERKLLQNIDYTLILSLMAILTMSAVVLYSASASVFPGDPTYYFRKHLMWIGLGFAALVVVLTINYSHLAKMSWHIYAITILMLMAVLAFGDEAKGATSWLGYGPLRIQPSEFAKVCMIISFAQFLVKRQGKLDRLWDLIPCFAFFIPPILLIMAQPDLGTSLVFVAILFGMMFIGGANPKLLAGIILFSLLVVIVVLVGHFRFGLPVPLEGYQLMRLVVFLNPYNDGYGGRGAGYNIIQSQVAIGSGGLWGQGLTKGSQVQLNFLPEHHTDFIFSVVGEELGFVGAASLLVLYFILIYRCIRIAFDAKDLFGVLLVTGVTSMITFHILENVGMTIGLMPITGLPLPLFSSGGSSMIANLLALGLVLNVNLRRQKIVF
ncbi:MAG: rod shape-determining protein RodA [Syntrophomonadaceae bacterium]|nr:rod shape-determining protein RodA [Syntrophomonadaceae bacterium]